MKKTKAKTDRRLEQGNALFLILIAVALFAALSYAVTQSGGSSGTIDKEQNIIDTARLIEMGNSWKMTAMRMILTGTSVSNIQFASSDPIASIYAPCTIGEDCVFAQEGGGAKFQSMPIGSIWLMVATTNPPLRKITGIGSTKNDFFLYSPNNTFSKIQCETINKALELSYSPVNFDSDGLITEIDAYPGKEQACFEVSNGSNTYVYYHVLLAQ